MNSTKKIAIGVGTGLVALTPIFALADGFASPSDASAVISTAVGNIGTVLSSSIPVVLAVAAALLGVMILWRFARRTIK